MWHERSALACYQQQKNNKEEVETLDVYKQPHKVLEFLDPTRLWLHFHEHLFSCVSCNNSLLDTDTNKESEKMFIIKTDCGLYMLIRGTAAFDFDIWRITHENFIEIVYTDCKSTVSPFKLITNVLKNSVTI